MNTYYINSIKIFAEAKEIVAAQTTVSCRMPFLFGLPVFLGKHILYAVYVQY
jgi:hypothetical protein